MSILSCCPLLAGVRSASRSRSGTAFFCYLAVDTDDDGNIIKYWQRYERYDYKRYTFPPSTLVSECLNSSTILHVGEEIHKGPGSCLPPIDDGETPDDCPPEDTAPASPPGRSDEDYLDGVPEAPWGDIQAAAQADMDDNDWTETGSDTDPFTLYTFSVDGPWGSAPAGGTSSARGGVESCSIAQQSFKIDIEGYLGLTAYYDLVTYDLLDDNREIDRSTHSIPIGANGTTGWVDIPVPDIGPSDWLLTTVENTALVPTGIPYP